MTSTPRGGRPRDAGRDAAILDAALDVLATNGYDGLTVDEVARRAGAGKATIYRRWSSKEALVVAAVGRVATPIAPEDLPDTGDLRSDFVALYRPQTAEDDARSLGITRGLASLLTSAPELAEAASRAMVEPFVSSQRLLMQRAVDRGEVRADVDVETLARISPSMTAYRLVVERKPVDVDDLLRILDAVVLPALRAGGPSS